MPSGRTFSIKPIGELIAEEMGRLPEGAVIVDPFANGSRLGTVTNDLNPEFDTDYHMDALSFMGLLDSGSADMVLYDPPYSITQATQLYKSYGREKLEVSVSNMGYWARMKDECARVLKPGGILVSCGWNTNGAGKGRGFVLERVLIVPHGGSKNDTLVTVEVKGGVPETV